MKIKKINSKKIKIRSYKEKQMKKKICSVYRIFKWIKKILTNKKLKNKFLKPKFKIKPKLSLKINQKRFL